MLPRSSRRLVLGSLFVLLSAASACYTDPAAELAAMQQTIDLADTINELVVRTTDMQFAVDSLRTVVARQDSTIAKLANLAGVPYSR